jgi:toxin-antitoxin system PIN domain toxin
VKIVDLNVLLYAVNSDAAPHARVLEWWEAAMNGEETIGLPWVVLLGFLRLTTHPRVFPRPLTPEAAEARVDAWLSVPNVRIVAERDGHWPMLKTLLHASGTAGNLTTDAHLATMAMTYDAVLVSCDADFNRFKGLRLENPLR